MASIGLAPAIGNPNFFGRACRIITPDDVCATCVLLTPQPGEVSVCNCPETEDGYESWPGAENEDGRIVWCRFHTESL